MPLVISKIHTLIKKWIKEISILLLPFLTDLNIPEMNIEDIKVCLPETITDWNIIIETEIIYFAIIAIDKDIQTKTVSTETT